MLTYMQIKNIIEDSYDLEDVIMGCIIIPLFLFLDFILIILQPLFYIIYNKWEW